MNNRPQSARRKGEAPIQYQARANIPADNPEVTEISNLNPNVRSSSQDQNQGSPPRGPNSSLKREPSEQLRQASQQLSDPSAPKSLGIQFISLAESTHISPGKAPKKKPGQSNLGVRQASAAQRMSQQIPQLSEKIEETRPRQNTAALHGLSRQDSKKLRQQGQEKSSPGLRGGLSKKLSPEKQRLSGQDPNRIYYSQSGFGGQFQARPRNSFQSNQSISKDFNQLQSVPESSKRGKHKKSEEPEAQGSEELHSLKGSSRERLGSKQLGAKQKQKKSIPTHQTSNQDEVPEHLSSQNIRNTSGYSRDNIQEAKSSSNPGHDPQSDKLHQSQHQPQYF